MAFFSVHPAARASFLVIVAGSGLVCGFVGTWLLPVAAALVHGGLGEIGRLGVVEKIFPAPPAFLELSRMQSEFFKVLCGILGVAILLVACVFASRHWRRFVVARGWMTAEEAKAFVERNDDY